jgi:hypothetical protein
VLDPPGKAGGVGGRAGTPIVGGGVAAPPAAGVGIPPRGAPLCASNSAVALLRHNPTTTRLSGLQFVQRMVLITPYIGDSIDSQVNEVPPCPWRAVPVVR